MTNLINTISRPYLFMLEIPDSGVYNTHLTSHVRSIEYQSHILRIDFVVGDYLIWNAFYNLKKDSKVLCHFLCNKGLIVGTVEYTLFDEQLVKPHRVSHDLKDQIAISTFYSKAWVKPLEVKRDYPETET